MSVFISGLDLGQTSDYSALVVVEQSQQQTPDIKQLENYYAVRHIYRWALQTPYTVIVADVRDWFQTSPLRKSTLVVDRTGVGRGVYDMLAAAGVPASIKPYSITCGNKPGDQTVPKVDLVASVQATLQTRRLAFADELEHADTLAKELENFRTKVTEDRNETFSAFRESDHDDLVLALALAVWFGERRGGGVIEQPKVKPLTPAWAMGRAR